MVFLFLVDVSACLGAKIGRQWRSPSSCSGGVTPLGSLAMLPGGLQATFTMTSPPTMRRSSRDGADPHAANGGFTLVPAGPMFREPLEVVVREVVEWGGLSCPPDVLPGAYLILRETLAL